jgi:SAM-dependent methyltransferase
MGKNLNHSAQDSNVAPKLLNIGCGRRFHPAWTNIDLESVAPEVMEHDITAGLPFENEQYDGVYHSHVLEHLEPTAGERLLDECYRVLRPGGVLRIAVPNLEQIAKLYLEQHSRAWTGDDNAAINYNWMKLELLDQLVRGQSGGRMGAYMASDEIQNSGFVKARVGDEFSRCQNHAEHTAKTPNGWQRIHDAFQRSKTRLTRWTIKRLMGKQALKSFDEGQFRNQGEIHRWMYDRYSLKMLCQSCGFVDFHVRSATESFIEEYETFELDAVAGNVRKPDSLFVECRRPLETTAAKQAA